jgi:hypothetical protein
MQNFYPSKVGDRFYWAVFFYNNHEFEGRFALGDCFCDKLRATLLMALR